jgi:hypothetical protein
MRLSSREVQRLIERYPADVQELFLGVRDCVFAAVPEAWEGPKRGGTAYFLTEDGTPLKGMICHVVPKTDEVEIGFIFGAFMPDPRGWLVGSQKAKRHLHLRNYEGVDWGYLEELMRASAEVDPKNFY